MDSFTGYPRQVMAWLLEQPEDKRFTVKEHRERRSNTANAYYWVLVTELSRALGISKDETHGSLLRQYGVCDVFTVLESVPLGDYMRYYDVFGHGVLNGREYKHVRVWKGSSEMDSAEFSNLLKGCIYECEQQGIQTLTPRELANLPWVDERKV